MIQIKRKFYERLASQIVVILKLGYPIPFNEKCSELSKDNVDPNLHVKFCISLFGNRKMRLIVNRDPGIHGF